jgi:flagellar motility protein MotE (MotC chaperone)
LIFALFLCYNAINKTNFGVNEMQALLSERELESKKQKREEEEARFSALHHADIFNIYMQMRRKAVVDSKKDEEEKKKQLEELSKIEKNKVMVFESMEVAEKFFAEHATARKKFLVVEVTEKGVYLDNYFYSCGDGAIYSGTIENVKQALITQQNKIGPKHQDYQCVTQGLAQINAYIHKKMSHHVRHKDELVDQHTNTNTNKL